MAEGVEFFVRGRSVLSDVALDHHDDVRVGRALTNTFGDDPNLQEGRLFMPGDAVRRGPPHQLGPQITGAIRRRVPGR